MDFGGWGMQLEKRSGQRVQRSSTGQSLAGQCSRAVSSVSELTDCAWTPGMKDRFRTPAGGGLAAASALGSPGAGGLGGGSQPLCWAMDQAVLLVPDCLLRARGGLSPKGYS